MKLTKKVEILSCILLKCKSDVFSFSFKNIQDGESMKKIIAVLMVCAICVTLSGCGTTYEDTNGDDVFTLQTITDKNIIFLETGASGLAYTESKLGDSVTSSEYSSKNFNGVSQIFLTNFITESDIRVYIGHMEVNSGNFKLVAINDDKIIKEFPLDSFNEEFLFEDIKGTFSIHIAGESANFEFYIDVY